MATNQQTREMQALLKINGGFPGKLTGIADSATATAIVKFQKNNGLDPAKASPEETLTKMRGTLIQDPKTVNSMKALAGSGDPDNVMAAQYGLAAFGRPIQPGTQMTPAATQALNQLAEIQARNTPSDAKPAEIKTGAAAPTKNTSFDPDVQKLQGYMRGLGITEAEVDGKKKQLGVDGINGPVTNAAMTKYKAENGLDNNDSFASVMKHMEDRLKKNPADLQQRMAETAAQGPNANPMNVSSMQIILNLLGPILSALTGGKINLETLKVDGINGPKTSHNLNGYKAATTMTAKPEAEPAKASPSPADAPESQDKMQDFLQRLDNAPELQGKMQDFLRRLDRAGDPELQAKVQAFENGLNDEQKEFLRDAKKDYEGVLPPANHQGMWGGYHRMKSPSEIAVGWEKFSDTLTEDQRKVFQGIKEKAYPGATNDTVGPLEAAVGLETEAQHRDRLGMSQKQYDTLKADQAEWQKKVDSGDPYTKQSPFMRADIGDRIAQQNLGLDDAKWSALKQENQKWQTALDNGERVQKTGPLAAAIIAANNAVPSAPAETQAQHRDRLGMSQNQYDTLKADQAEWQKKVDSGDPYTKQSPFMRADISDRIAQQNLGLDDAKWSALKQENQKWQTALDNGERAQKTGPLAAAIIAANNEAPKNDPDEFGSKRTPYRAEPMFPERYGPVTEDDIRRGAAALREQQERQGGKPQKAVPQNDPEEFGSRRSPYRAEPMFDKKEKPVTEDDIKRGAAALREPKYGEMRQQYNTASGAEVRDRMLQQRAELRETGYSPRDVKAIVRDNRVQELEGSGMDRRNALNQANIETRMVDNIERGMMRDARNYDRAVRQDQAAYSRAMRAEDRDITRISRDFGQAAGVLTDRNPRNDHQATRILTGVGIEAVLRGGIPGMGAGGARGGYGMERTQGIVADGGVVVSGGRGGSNGSSREYNRMVQQEDRDITRISRDFGKAAGILTDRNSRNDHQATRILSGAGIEAVLRGGIPGMGVGGARGGFGMSDGGNPISNLMSSISGGNTRTYTAQPLERGAYVGYDRSNAREWNGNQIRPEFDGARSYGNAADPRMALSTVREQPIMAAEQPQTPQERIVEQRRMQEMYAP